MATNGSIWPSAKDKPLLPSLVFTQRVLGWVKPIAILSGRVHEGRGGRVRATCGRVHGREGQNHRAVCGRWRRGGGVKTIELCVEGGGGARVYRDKEQ